MQPRSRWYPFRMSLGLLLLLVVANVARGQHNNRTTSTDIGERTVTLQGWVRTDNGTTITSGVEVRIETSEAMLAEQPANTNGYFEFSDLPKVTYHLTITADGYQTYQETLDLSHAAGKALVNVYLSRSEPQRPAVRPSSTFTDNNASKKARREYEKGARELQARNLSEAAAHLEKAVKEYPCYARAQTDLATVRSQQHQFDRSESALKKAIHCDPDFLDAYSELGQLYYNEKRFQESEAVLQEGLRRSPGGWQFYYQMAADDYRLGQFGKAEQEYLKAESFSSEVPAEIHVRLADVYLKEGAFEKAYSEMQAYLRMEPNGRFASKVKTIMQRMKADGISGAPRLRNSRNPLSGFTAQ